MGDQMSNQREREERGRVINEGTSRAATEEKGKRKHVVIVRGRKDEAQKSLLPTD